MQTLAHSQAGRNEIIFIRSQRLSRQFLGGEISQLLESLAQVGDFPDTVVEGYIRPVDADCKLIGFETALQSVGQR